MLVTMPATGAQEDIIWGCEMKPDNQSVLGCLARGPSHPAELSERTIERSARLSSHTAHTHASMTENTHRPGRGRKDCCANQVCRWNNSVCGYVLNLVLKWSLFLTKNWNIWVDEKHGNNLYTIIKATANPYEQSQTHTPVCVSWDPLSSYSQKWVSLRFLSLFSSLKISCCWWDFIVCIYMFM